MSESLSMAVEGLVNFTNGIIQKAQAELKVTTDKLAAGPITADDAVDAMVRMSTVWLNGMAGAAVEGFDAATTLAKYLGTRTVVSEPLSVGQPGPWKLALTAPLVSAKQDEILPKCLEVVPDKVEQGDQQTFYVRATIAQTGGGTYEGNVVATNDTGETHDIFVMLQVP
jgi:hypothetical protein